MNNQPRTRRLIRVMVAFGVALALGGCIVVPIGPGPGPGYYRPHHYYRY